MNIWYNFKTDQHDEVTVDSDDKAIQYIPQEPAAQGMYRLLRDKMNHSILEAVLKVLSASIGEPLDSSK